MKIEWVETLPKLVKYVLKKLKHLNNRKHKAFKVEPTGIRPLLG